MSDLPSVYEVPSRATRVVFFEDRAEVTRVGEGALAKGAHAVALAGVSPLVDDRSVQARVRPASGGEARVRAVRVRRRTVRSEALALDPSRVLELEHEERERRQQAREADERERRARARLARAEVALRAWSDGLAEIPRGIGASESERERWGGAFEALAREADDALTEALAASREKRAAEGAQARARARLQASRGERPRWEALVEVQVEVDAEGPVEIEVTYRVPCALWRPEHVARLLGAEGDEGATSVEGPRGRTAKVRVRTYATVWQRTGERWSGVEAVFSTARPSRDATAPLVSEDVLTARKKTEHEKQHVVVDAREQSIAVAGLGRGTRAVEEMPGVDDGGEARVFRAKGAVTLASDGRPTRVEVHASELTMTLERVAFPERAPVAHLRATGTLSGSTPLLAGPVRLARGPSMVGHATIGYVGPGEPFELGFGSDDAVRLRRETSEKRETSAVLGTQKIERTARVYLSNLSGEARTVLVTERIPVSEIEDVTITPTETTGWKLDARDGFARAEVELRPRATRELLLVYEVRAGARVVLPF